MTVLVGWAFLLVATGGYGLASVLQAMGARRAAGLRAVVNPLYLLGLAVDLLAFVMLTLALDRLSEVVVNAVLATSIGITVLLARVLMHVAMGRRDVAALIAVIGGTVLLALGASTAQPPPNPPTIVGVVAIGVGGVGALVALLWRRGPVIPLAVASGLAFFLVTLAARSIDTTELEQVESIGGLAPFVLPTACLAGAGVLTALAMMRAFQSGSVGAVVALSNGTSVVVSGIVDVVYLGEGLGIAWVVLLGLVTILAGCTVLAYGPGMRAVNAEPADAAAPAAQG